MRNGWSGRSATAIGAFLFARLLRRLELRDGTALAALLLYGLAPFTVFLGGSMMNHVTETTWLLAAALALAVATADERPHPAAAFALGLCLGIAATIRPTDAAAFAIPSGAWLLWRVRGGVPHLRALVCSGLGVALPMALLFYVNWQQTGHPLRFGYIEMWGNSHELGFHPAPWGVAHTPARGLELINLYLLRLQDYMFESAGPGLLFASMALVIAPRLRGFDRWLLVACGMLLLAYFAYWHDGFYLGPRFMLPLAPWIALWTARLPAMLTVRRVAVPVIRATVFAGVVALLIGLVVAVPLRARQYRNGMQTMRLDADAAAAAAGAANAVILVRESWGAQMVARLWALGITRTETEHIYRSFDACRLEGIIPATEGRDGSAAELRQRLAPFASDSSQLRADPTLPDTTVRFVPGGPHRSATSGSSRIARASLPTRNSCWRMRTATSSSATFTDWIRSRRARIQVASGGCSPRIPESVARSACRALRSIRPGATGAWLGRCRREFVGRPARSHHGRAGVQRSAAPRSCAVARVRRCHAGVPSLLH